MTGFLADTSFLITLADARRPNHAHAQRYLREAVTRRAPVFLSVIAIAEFHRKQSVNDLPLRNFRVLPFNVDHAMMAGTLAEALLRDQGDSRDAVKDDVKLLAQATCEAIPFVLTEDERTLAKFASRLRESGHVTVQSVLLADGFDEAWFNGGQSSIPGS